MADISLISHGPHTTAEGSNYSQLPHHTGSGRSLRAFGACEARPEPTAVLAQWGGGIAPLCWCTHWAMGNFRVETTPETLVALSYSRVDPSHHPRSLDHRALCRRFWLCRNSPRLRPRRRGARPDVPAHRQGRNPRPGVAFRDAPIARVRPADS